MVRLDSITTKTGDAGQTRLGDGTEVSKTTKRIEAIGAIDEMNSVIGLCCAHGIQEPYLSWLKTIQNDLFDLGAELSVPESASTDCTKGASVKQRKQYFDKTKIPQLENWLAELHEQLPALDSFILPGGSVIAATLHLARSITRRAERETLRLTQEEVVSSEITIYLNRLSDLLFQLARITEDPQTPATLWKPGKS